VDAKLGELGNPSLAIPVLFDMSIDDAAPQDPPMTGVGLLEEWFVRYNPFFIASAGLTLAGAWQLSLGIAELGWDDGSVLPTCVVALYQVLLGLSCGAVARKGTIRPAVILALVQTLFVIDPTFQTNRIAMDATRGIGVIATVSSLMLAGLVMRLVSRALHVSFARGFRPLLFLTVGGIALGPQLLDASILHLANGYLVLVVWGAVVVVTAVRFPVRIEIKGSRDEWAETVARRASVYLNFLFPTACLVHLKGWFDMFEPGLDWRTPLVLAFALMVAARREQFVWLGALIAFSVAFWRPEHTSGALLFIAGLLIVRWRLGLSYRLAIGAVGAAWTSLVLWQWTGGPFPDAPAALTLLAVFGLIGLAIHRRSLLPLIPIPFMARATAWGISGASPMVRGIVLLATGFLFLAAGVVANLYTKRSSPNLAETRANHEA